MDSIEKKLSELREEKTFGNLFSIICGNGGLTAAEYKEDSGIKKLILFGL